MLSNLVKEMKVVLFITCIQKEILNVLVKEEAQLLGKTESYGKHFRNLDVYIYIEREMERMRASAL